MSNPQTDSAYAATFRAFADGFFAERWPEHDPELASPGAVAMFLRAQRGEGKAEATRRRTAYALAAVLKESNPSMWAGRGLPEAVEHALDDAGDSKRAAEAIARQVGGQPWYMGVRVGDHFVLELLSRSPLKLTNGDHYRGFRLHVVVAELRPNDVATH